jgi:cytochrome P450
VQAIGNAVLALAADPSAFESLRRHPELVHTAAAELLRYDTPLQMFERWVLEDLDWNGVRLERGAKVGLLFGSANRDEAVFEDADRLVLDRTQNPHVSFGAGVHFCVGAPLALVELEVALERLARRTYTIEVAERELPRTPSLIFRGVERLPVVLAPVD